MMICKIIVFFSSPQGYIDGLYYELSYWTYNGSNYYSNPLQISNPSSNVTIGATFTRRPDNTGKNVHFSTTVGSPIVVYWTDNVNTNVTTYYIYRKVYKNGFWGSETLMGTVNRGVQQFQDPDYLLANYKQYDLINYDVREYFTTDGTYSYPDWNVVYGQLYSIDQNGNMATSVTVEKPTEYSISNYPNPFNSTTKISFAITNDGHVSLKIFDILGREIAVIADQVFTAGRYTFEFDINYLPSGTYIYHLVTDNKIITKKMQVIK
ncbi:MAG: T9SS type A sorting domain-containing protein [Stygiobacter sp.]